MKINSAAFILCFLIVGAIQAQPAANVKSPTSLPNRSAEIVTEVPLPPAETPRDIPLSRMKATASSTRNDYSKPGNAIDGNPATGWSSGDGSLKKLGPQWLQLELDGAYEVDALRYFLAGKVGAARYANWIGRMRTFEVQVSGDGKAFTTVASGEWDRDDLRGQRIAFKPVKAKFVRLICGLADFNLACASEVSLESPHPPAPVSSIKLAPPADAHVRLAVFARRNSPGQQRAVADRLSKVLDRRHPAMAGYFSLYDKGDCAGALRCFTRTLLDRCKDRRKAVLDSAEADSRETTGIVSEMLANIVNFTEHSPKFGVGEPGVIDWDSPPIAAELGKAGQTVLSPAIFNPLLWRYRAGGDPRVIAKWSEYLDDMSASYAGYSKCVSFSIFDHDSWGARRVRELLGELLQVELARPGLAERLPETTLPRLLLKMIPENLAMGATYFHANAQNWTPVAAEEMVRTGLILDDLIVQDVPLVEQALRQIERYEAKSNLPDGTEAEQAMWYNWGFPRDALRLVGWMEQYPGPLFTAQRKADLWEAAIRRFRYTCQIYTPQAQWPLFLRGDSRKFWGMAGMGANRKPDPFYPELMTSPVLLEDPSIQPILATIGPDPKAGATVSFTSNYFPWGGYRVIRESWQPDAAYASMFSSPHPGKYGARGGSDQLNLGIHAFGKDLLVDDAKGHYSGFSSPVTVDGLPQDYRAGYPRWGHKQYLINGWQKPDTSRWLTSDAFEFMEGTYRGPYGKEAVGPNPGQIADALKQCIRDVTHQRQVIFVRQAGLWIATDRIASENPHNYMWRWMLPCSARADKSNFAFTPQEIEVQEADHAIVTRKLDGVNLTMRTIGLEGGKLHRQDRDGAVEYEYYGKKDVPQNRVSEIQFTVPSRKEVLAVTPILPRKQVRDDLKSLTPIQNDDAVGFTAVTPDGSTVHYLTARHGAGSLAVGPARAEAEALLAVEKAGRITGLVLGSRTFGGAKPPAPDFAFELTGDRKLAKVTPILRAIEQVEIAPARDTFASHETVSMSCPTGGVEIRYTLDGREPSRTSTLYTGPFEIADTTRLRVKAFRPGLTEAPGELNFTHVSPEALAVFTKQAPAAPAKATPGEPGLHYTYYEGNWQTAMLNPGLLQPTSEGAVPTVLDLSPRKTTGPFTFVYDGFLDVPTEGVYTFHAPPEFTDNKTDNGYDLVLWIDGERWYPSTRRHAYGNWSIALAKGPHAFRLKYLDYRGDKVELKLGPDPAETILIDHNRKGPAPRNFPGMLGDYVWGGGVPELLVSGPGLSRQPIPATWFKRPAKAGN